MLNRATFVFFFTIIGIGILIFGDANSARMQKGLAVHSYVILMKAEPVMRYSGGLPKYAATKPAVGQKIDPNNLHVRRYVRLLQDQHTQTLEAVGVQASKKVYSYTYVINGFTAMLTKAQAEALAKQPDVHWVARDQKRQLTTDASPDFLELTDDDGPWETGFDGTGVVVGVIDSGIWPEHPSFHDDGSFPLPPVTPIDLPAHPACDFGNTVWNSNDAPYECNNKLIGARKYLETYKLLDGLEPDEYDSARDDNGHGSHTASTAAGNSDIETRIFDIPRGSVSGMAPRAHVLAYRVCGQQGCYTSDSAAAIDQAVVDGVDVINFSIGSAVFGASLMSPDVIAYLFAADAGVFVATSAGNMGPEPGTIGSPAAVPWITAVGASTHDRAFLSEITLQGPGTPPTGVWGASVTPGITDFKLVDAEGIADIEGDTTGQCLNEFLPDTFQSNDVVLCNQYDFGVARMVRVEYVKKAGGGAVILHNSPVVTVTPTDNHVLPTLHTMNAVGQPLKDYLIANPGEITVSFTTSKTQYAEDDPRVIENVMASFSSRGPNPLSEDIIKPDVTAPGISILAGNTITPLMGAPGQLYQAIMGTSMSSPHVAGIYALIKQAHPDWSPAMARSALMTTAYQEDMLKEDAESPADAFDMGAGHIDPGDATERGSLFEPGLVYEAGILDYLGFLCDVGREILVDSNTLCKALEALGIPTEAINLNYPSIGIANISGSQTVMRTLTSVASGAIDYQVTVDSPPGFEVMVSPAALRLMPGQSASYEITVSNQNAPIGEWRFGSITWEADDDYEVRSPIAVRAAPFRVHDEEPDDEDD